MRKYYKVCLLLALVTSLTLVPSCSGSSGEIDERVKEMFSQEKIGQVLTDLGTSLYRLFEKKYELSTTVKQDCMLKCDLGKGDVLEAYIYSEHGNKFLFYILDTWRKPVLDAGRVSEYRFSFRAKYTGIYVLCFRNLGFGTVKIRYNCPVRLVVVTK